MTPASATTWAVMETYEVTVSSPRGMPMALVLHTKDGTSVPASTRHVVHAAAGAQTYQFTVPLLGIAAGEHRLRCLYAEDELQGEKEEVHQRTDSPQSGIITIVVPLASVIDPWQACSQSCDSGTQTRRVRCLASPPGVSAYDADDATCSAVGIALPARVRECFLRPCVVAPVAQWMCSGNLCSSESSWSVCSRSCGGGVRTRFAGCMRFDASRASFVLSVLCTQQRPADSEPCNLTPCEVFTYANSGWSQCDQACGDGFQFRSSRCESQLTRASVGMARCANVQRPTSIRVCSAPTCPSYRWRFSPFTTCDRSCGGGRAVRTRQCTSDGAVVADIHCQQGSVSEPAIPNACSNLERFTCRKCNTQPCVRYSYAVGGFSTCSRSCGGGTQHRAVQCRATAALSAISTAAPLAACFNATVGQPMLVAEAACATAACDPCEGHRCSGRGTCKADTIGLPVCTCDAGFTAAVGMRCMAVKCGVGEMNSPSDGLCFHGTLHRNGGGATGPLLRCETSLAARQVGRIATLTREGRCCPSGMLDVCGQCDGQTKVVDVLGTCCSSLPLDEDGICCGGIVDSCGVCDGDGGSCSTRVQVTLRAPTKASQLPVLAVLQAGTPQRLSYEADLRVHFAALLLISDRNRISITSVAAASAGAPGRRLVAGTISAVVPEFIVAPSAAGAFTAGSPGGGSNVTLRSVERALALNSAATAKAPAGSAFAILAGISVEAKGVCGNGICETGERCNQVATIPCCPQDCLHVFKACPTPKGTAQPCGGHGECFASSGACNCHLQKGYTGSACGECLPGFVKLDSLPSGGGSPQCVVYESTITESGPAVTGAASSDWPVLHTIYVLLGAGGVIATVAMLCWTVTKAAHRKQERRNRRFEEWCECSTKMSVSPFAQTPERGAPPAFREASAAERKMSLRVQAGRWHQAQVALASHHIERAHVIMPIRSEHRIKAPAALAMSPLPPSPPISMAPRVAPPISTKAKAQQRWRKARVVMQAVSAVSPSIMNEERRKSLHKLHKRRQLASKDAQLPPRVAKDRQGIVATIIQRHWRGFLGRKSFDVELETQLDLEELKLAQQRVDKQAQKMVARNGWEAVWSVVHASAVLRASVAAHVPAIDVETGAVPVGASSAVAGKNTAPAPRKKSSAASAPVAAPPREDEDQELLLELQGFLRDGEITKKEYDEAVAVLQ